MEFIFSASETCFAPSAPMLLRPILRVGVERKEKQTSAAADSRKTMCGGVLERGEGLVLLQALRDVLCALCTELVVLQTANGSQKQTSAAADSRETMRSGVLELLEGPILGETL